MSLMINIAETRKGPTLKLTVAVTIACPKEQKKSALSASSKVFSFDGLADVRIKTSIPGIVFTTIHFTTGVKYTTSVSSMRNNLAKDVEIKMNVTCDKLKCSKSWICSEHWTDTDMGEMCAVLLRNNPEVLIYSSLFEVMINVHKVHKPSFIKLYEDSDFTDFRLSTPGGIVAFHKAFLAAHSDVFKTMFTGNWKETNENMLEMKGYGLETVKHMKDFLYLGKLPENYDDLCSLLTLATQYCIADLKADCVRKLVETVSPENLYSVHEFACKNNLPELTYALMELAADDVVNGSYECKKKESEKMKETA